MSWGWGWLAGALLAGGLGACAIVDKVDPRYDTINSSTEKARNQSVLLNIVRASQSAPLNFIAFSKVTGQTSTTMGMALPQFALGPFAPGGLAPTPQRAYIFSNTSLNATLGATNSFDISVLESKDFYTALLNPVDLVTLNYFFRQGYSRELLFWLFTDSVEEMRPGRAPIGYRYDPEDEGCPAPGSDKCFRELVEIALMTGLSVETKAEEKRGGGGKSGVTTYARFCFDAVQKGRGSNELRRHSPERFDRLHSLLSPRPHLPMCRTAWRPAVEKRSGGSGESDTLEFTVSGTRMGAVKYRIVTRSTFGIYQFLGRLMQHGGTDELLSGVGGDRRLLTITTDQTACFASVDYNGRTYCVPEHAENTKRIFSVLTQLIALKTQSSDLAITPTVRVSP